MKYYKVDDNMLRNSWVNECEFNNLYLTSLYDVDKYRLYYGTIDYLRSVLLGGSIEEEEFGRFDLYRGEFYFGESIPEDAETYFVVRMVDLKLFPLYRVERGGECVLESDLRVLVERYCLNRKNAYYIPTSRDLFSYSKFNALSHLFSMCH